MIRFSMTQVAKTSYTTLLFLMASLLFAYTEVFSFGVGVFAWMGGIQLFNSVAPKMPFARLIHWVHAMTFELFAFLGVAVLRFIPIGQKVKGNGRPILLVHGYMNHSSVWVLFKKRLESLGLGPVYMINLGHPFRSIRAYAEKVCAKAEQIKKETGRSDLLLIGHSMGGLVCSLYAAKLAEPNSVTDVITIASPLHGTPVAYVGLGPNAKEMRPRSELLQEMREAMRKKKEIRYFHLATKTDQLVIPANSAIIPENQYFLFEDIGHASLLYSQRACDQIANWLKNQPIKPSNF